ncbi:hypothetical protein TOPH_00564 [Tolypocladium ophioglossoides CBS 100239]|uniref:Uncharacterized protein n=1 Tax=Tolypocladium ophioglossoides (strain CBS 100239) TaxID=1163406 RepID=A0A0L0NN65_TOLOC|nr:hypothetical protein TOPH_00564 [Tolypocladium ophioglossoides CBS 100239]
MPPIDSCAMRHERLLASRSPGVVYHGEAFCSRVETIGLGVQHRLFISKHIQASRLSKPSWCPASDNMRLQCRQATTPFFYIATDMPGHLQRRLDGPIQHTVQPLSNLAVDIFACPRQRPVRAPHLSPSQLGHVLIHTNRQGRRQRSVVGRCDVKRRHLQRHGLVGQRKLVLPVDLAGAVPVQRPTQLRHLL